MRALTLYETLSIRTNLLKCCCVTLYSRIDKNAHAQSSSFEIGQKEIC